MKSRGVRTLFNDVLLAFNLIIMFLLLMVVLLISPNEDNPKHGDVVLTTRYVVVMEWNHDVGDDVDLWMKEGTDGNTIFFASKEGQLAHLERDDLGQRNDSVDGELVVENNQELIIIREVFPSSQYVINAHMYAKEGDTPVSVTVTVYRITPSYQQIVQKTVVMTKNKEEHTMAILNFDAVGDVASIDDYFIPVVTSVSIGEATGP